MAEYPPPPPPAPTPTLVFAPEAPPPPPPPPRHSTKIARVPALGVYEVVPLKMWTTFDAVPVGATQAGTPPESVRTSPFEPDEFASVPRTPAAVLVTRPAELRPLNVIVPDDVRPVSPVSVPAIVLSPAIVMPPAVVLILPPAAIVPTTVALPARVCV